MNQELAQQIQEYYLSRINELSETHAFHFLSRIFLWTGSEQAKAGLETYKVNYSLEALPRRMQEIQERYEHVNAHATGRFAGMRQPIYQKYPKLLYYQAWLFHVLTARTVYGIDLSEEFFRLVDTDVLIQYGEELMKDSRGFAVLSTNAVHYAYLVEQVVKGQDVPVAVIDRILKHSEELNEADPMEVSLKIYLLTHMIIGETRYYAENIKRPEIYVPLLAQIEALIEKNFEDISLDIKFEFLVCARLCGVAVDLEKRIEEEATQSLSSNGMYLVDTLNTRAKKEGPTINSREHANILYIMANTPSSKY